MLKTSWNTKPKKAIALIVKLNTFLGVNSL